jgi:cell fate regulator YaaT (PSP1 superfamily)
MPVVVGVVFSQGGQVYPFDPDGLELAWNERVVCNTPRGREYGRVVQPNHEVAAETVFGPLKKVLRRVSAQDEETRRRQREQSRQAMTLFKRVTKERGIVAKPFAAEMTFDGGRVVLTFGAEEKTDLRDLGHELSRELGFRLELRQVGPREGARQVGGGGMCGDKLCSTRFPSHENPITLRMAKDQDLPMNPGRITGLCGRLRCCLAFEHPIYRSFRDRAPAVGRTIRTARGSGVVRSYKVPLDGVMVRLEGGEDDELVTLGEILDNQNLPLDQP